MLYSEIFIEIYHVENNENSRHSRLLILRNIETYKFITKLVHLKHLEQKHNLV